MAIHSLNPAPFGQFQEVAVQRISIIRKDPAGFGAAPNLPDTAAAREAFSWDSARAALAGLPGGGLNIAHEAVDRHAAGALAGKVALRWLPQAGARRDITYAELARESNRFANVLRGLGVIKGDAVFVLCGRTRICTRRCWGR